MFFCSFLKNLFPNPCFSPELPFPANLPARFSERLRLHRVCRSPVFARWTLFLGRVQNNPSDFYCGPASLQMHGSPSFPSVPFRIQASLRIPPPLFTSPAQLHVAGGVNGVKISHFPPRSFASVEPPNPHAKKMSDPNYQLPYFAHILSSV